MSAVQASMVNPIIPGFAPDPSVVLIDGTFFLVTSSFHLFPGLPIYASTDLCSWRHIGNAINRAEQMSFENSGTNLIKNEDWPNTIAAAGGLYAPTIRQHQGKVYIVCTNAIHNPTGPSTVRFENFIVWTTDIWSDSWSDPVYFDFYGIDPSLYFDESGRAYIQGSGWGAETTIKCFEIDIETGAKLSEEKVIWVGHSKVIPEGPHLYQHQGWLYLLIAEGGTHDDHHITVARSKDIWGPFESYTANPILKPSNPDNAIQYTGHGDLFQDQDSKWWMVCLGARKQGNRCLFGRETFISPVTWNEDGWPCLSPPVLDLHDILGPRERPVQFLDKLPSSNPFVSFVWIRHPDERPIDEIVSLDDDCSRVLLKPLKTDISSKTGPIAFIGQRLRRYGAAKVDLNIGSLLTQRALKAGIAFYKDEHRFTRIYWDSKRSEVVFEFFNRAKSIHRTASAQAPSGESIRLSINYGADAIELSVGTTGEGPFSTLGSVDVADVSDADFIGPLVGVFATSDGDEGVGSDVEFHRFSVG